MSLRILVTGATSGIGLATARALARRAPEATLLVHGRDPARLAAVAAETGATPLRADLLELAQVEALAARAAPVDVLVANAGAVFAERALTGDGHERTWQLNQLAAFVLATRLAPPRVLVVASAAHRRARIHWPDPDALAGWPAYKQSKLANVLLARGLATRGAHAVALDPGVVATRFAHGLPGDDPLRRRLLGQHRGDPAVPGATLARLAVDDHGPAPGAYVGAGGGAGKLDPAGRDDDAADRLWQLCERATASRAR